MDIKEDLFEFTNALVCAEDHGCDVAVITHDTYLEYRCKGINVPNFNCNCLGTIK